MIKTTILSFCFLIASLSNSTLHKFHISKSVIAYSEPDQALQITLYLFIDDLENALKKQGIDKLFLCTKKETAEAEAVIFEYIQQKFKIEIDQEAYNYEFIGKEASEDLQAVWCYLEISDIAPPKEIKLDNSLLVEMFDDQKNMVNIVGPNKAKSYLMMSKTKLTAHIQF